ncbi:MAG TPA: UDP-N-acetylmuramate dehydrogenase [Thermoflexia bacterium]|nr:UDP-N-acetylmuramate dehydrogenase [Thermoflexia bacterium]
MTTSPDLDALAAALGDRVRRDEPLARYTRFGVGGPADLLIVCESVDEVVRAVELARRHGVEWLVLGGGCNVLVADSGVRGLVIINRAARVEVAGPVAWAEAGALLAALARETVERGLAGLEWAAGLPGTVGGAVVGNAGAFGGDIAGVLHSVTVLGPDSAVVERPNEWFEFRYRGSRIKGAGEQRSRGYVVLAATFGLQPGDPESLVARASEILEWRRTRHPAGATMGSTFKNPPGSHAGYLIEQAGLRGYRIGGAQISELHGNFFMNTGNATAADVLALIEYARAEVKRRFGVELELEIELVGWSDSPL